jgi:hypothetical protein
MQRDIRFRILLLPFSKNSTMIDQYAPFLNVSILDDEVIVQCLDASPWKNDLEVAEAFLERYRTDAQYQHKSLKLYLLEGNEPLLLYNLPNPTDEYSHLRVLDAGAIE